MNNKPSNYDQNQENKYQKQGQTSGQNSSKYGQEKESGMKKSGQSNQNENYSKNSKTESEE